MEDHASQSNEAYKHTLHIAYRASWCAIDVPALSNQDRTAGAFGPAFRLDKGESWPDGSSNAGGVKPVMYIPVKRLEGNLKVPSLGIVIELVEKEARRSIELKGHAGAAVTIRVFNRFFDAVEVNSNPRHHQHRKRINSHIEELQGKLDEHGRCHLTVNSETITKWIDSNGKLKGRVNEILLDFSFEINSISQNGSVLKGQSSNRVFLYRKKMVVFLPGVFGSQIPVRTPEGRDLGFPNFYPERDEFRKEVASSSLTAELAVKAMETYEGLNQGMGGLECDAEGNPLLSPFKATLFSLYGIVYDVFDKCHDARAAYFSPVPKSFRLIELKVHAYDWRLDLTAAAEALEKAVVNLQQQEPSCLRMRPDFDDEIALAGHSTGGVIIRRALGYPAMKTAVSHAFFMNVPFRGAPKALGVIATGEDPPGGDRMIPFVKAESLRSLALGMPIVYHLAPTRSYPGRVAGSPSNPGSEGQHVEHDKHAFVADAIELGFMPPLAFVKPWRKPAISHRLAETADRWHALWAERFERRRALPVLSKMFPDAEQRVESWFKNEVQKNGLKYHYYFRQNPGDGWNETLAKRAADFHLQAEAVSTSGEWADKSYIFYSVAPKPTTLQVQIQRVSEHSVESVQELLREQQDVGIDLVPPRGVGSQRNPYNEGPLVGHRYVPAPFVNQWLKNGDHSFKVIRWQMFAVDRKWAGDSTVPVQSLLGFGGRATVVKPIPLQHLGEYDPNTHANEYYAHNGERIPAGPEHSDAPSSPYVWERVIEILQGTLDGDEFVEKKCDTVNGVPAWGKPWD
jgi:hypothetical protein